MDREYLHKSWEQVAHRRRLLLLFLVLVPTIFACSLMTKTLSHKSSAILETLLVIFFGILYAWISIGFWASAAGFMTIMRRYDRLLFTNTKTATIRSNVRTAIVMPVYNEAVNRIYAGLCSIYRSLKMTEYADNFDLFILSDSNDPDKWIEEESAWAEMCRLFGRSRIYYRNRRVNIKRKSGNIADFCRRWGANYKYMVVLDADSLIAGTLLVRMVEMMEQNNNIGILQTSTRAVNAKTLFARLQQFASNLYSPMFSAGLHFWQRGDAQYWGHNAIIRIEPFMQHCALKNLSGRPPWGGDILSHDFVEAALMRRAGWGVWLAYWFTGSYEELPPTLPDDLGRDRRWCQGNMQHMRLLFAKGLFPAHRALFFAGAMAYVSGLLWFMFLSFSTAEAISEAIFGHTYFPSKHSLFPDWPVWHPGWAIGLISSTAFLLFVPKILSIIIVALKQRRAHEFGGIYKLFVSVLAEIILSTLFAPVRMIFHSKFVFATILGRQVSWEPQRREQSMLSWADAVRLHGPGMTFGFFWGGVVLLINPSFFWWLTPIITALILSVPLSVWSSSSAAGERLRKLGIFLTPEEIEPSRELKWMEDYLREYRESISPLSVSKGQGFIRAVADPCVNFLHLSLLRNERHYSEKILSRRESLRQKALRYGPEGLTKPEKKELLSDPFSMSFLHRMVWETADDAKASTWGIALFQLPGKSNSVKNPDGLFQ